nr:hypothetical protein [uncultured Limnohabitans sp.]
MKSSQIASITALTALYLCFELAFNARLLDVVGGVGTAEQIHYIERYGRVLSGAAVALIVLQLLLSRRTQSKIASPRGVAILFWCLLAASITFASLQIFIDTLVEHSSAAFRRTAVSIVLVQRALVKGEVELDGLIENDPRIFSRPEGKTFLALFPLMVSSIDRLDEKIADVKLQLISRQISDELGGAAGYYKKYTEAIKNTKEQWASYRSKGGSQSLDDQIKYRQNQAWRDYLDRLGKQGWTPATVPPIRHDAVRRKVKSEIPVTADWLPSDEAGFKEAVAIQVRRRVSSSNGKLNTQIPLGMGWGEFLSHPNVQSKLQNQLKLPSTVVVRAEYGSAAEFEKTVFTPLLTRLVRLQLPKYEASIASFADGQRFEQIGRDAVRAVLVPPVALLFSLLGAIGHFSKLLYLITCLTLNCLNSPASKSRYLFFVPASVICSLWIGLSLSSNVITNSRLYTYMRAEILNEVSDTSVQLGPYMLVNALHVVAIGQGLGYPANEFIRTRILGGITYGYENEKSH